ncbi:roadblock/LC7 domain-containing protein [Streptomyces lycii]|uniref:Roadblock/LC7 domain-containing protein n=1 Tax=Streptomyces lycii TaxID=2654337 RepID=A0ABQ7FCQ1_9ACTN|nr:roadblock/LC7 domain-containing protein [Streptomyces lycii]KAF4405591.1 roadblock/LC7 domain-containing protein [Streptomyces lycii]
MTHRSGPDLDWLLESLIQRIPRTRCAVLLSSDGLVKAAHGTQTDTADALAAAASAIYALARGLASAIGDQGNVRQIVAEVGDHVVLVATGGEGARLLVAAERDADLTVLGYEMASLAKSVGTHLATPTRHVPTPTSDR